RGQARLAATRDGRWLIGSGVTLVLVGTGVLASVLAVSVPVAIAVPAWTIAGFGMGLAYGPITVLVLREAPPGEEGSASASLMLSDALGWALGTGAGGAAVAAAKAGGWGLSVGVAVAFAGAAIVGVAGRAVVRRRPA